MSVLFTIMSAMPYVVALFLGLLIPMLGVLCYSRFGAGLAVIAGMYAVEVLLMNPGGLQLGISLYYTDFALVFVGSIALLRLLTARDTPRWHWAWSLYTFAFLMSLILGLISFGSAAGVQARAYFYSVMVGSYCMSFPFTPRRVALVLNVLVAMSIMMLFTCAYRWVVYYTPITELLPPGGAYNPDGPIRVILSQQTLVLSQVLVAGIFFAALARGALLARFVAPLLLAAVVALQHRSVWLSVLAGVMAALLVAGARRSSKIGQTLVLAGIVAVTALPLVFSEKLSGLSSQVAGSASRAVDGGGTVGERFDSWQELLKLWAAGGPRSLLIGQSFGTDATRYVQSSVRGGEHKIDYAAHNHYVQTLFNLGLIGLVGFLVVAGYTLAGLYRMCANSSGADPTAALLLVLLVMQFCYYVPYGTDYLQSVLLGVSIAYVAGRERDEKSELSLTIAGEPPPTSRRWSMWK
jgi:O-Antigen ligase